MLPVTNAKYMVWDVLALQSRWLKLYLAPQLGGRLIQLMLDDHPFFFVHPKLEGKVPDETRLDENGAWLNWGGEKIWPAPQGWQSKEQWPGPPDPVLDGGNYHCSEVNTEGDKVSVTLTSPFDAYTGLQIEKKVILEDSTASLEIHATFYNRSDKPISWSVWPVCQLNAPEPGPHNQYLVVCPVNTKTVLENGFKVMHGLVNNPQNKKDGEGNLVVDFQYLIGKTGLDANAGWAAFHKRMAGKVFIYQYVYEPGENYPEDTSVQIWTQGRGQIFSRNRIADFKDDQENNPPYVELELLSPIKSIPPGSSVTFNYRMQVSTVPANTQIKTITNLAVVCQSLELITLPDQYQITGQYGVFQQGMLLLQVANEQDEVIQIYEEAVSPLTGFKLNQTISHAATLSNNITVSLVMLDEGRTQIGMIDRQTFMLKQSNMVIS